MALVVGLGFVQAVCEAVGILMLLPALQYVQAGGDVVRLVATNPQWPKTVALFSSLGQPVTLVGILVLAFVAVLARQSAQFAQRVIAARKRWQLVAGIKERLFRTFLAADLRAVEQEGTGRMLAEFTSETETAATALFCSLQSIILVGVFTVYLVGLLSISAPLTTMAIAIMAVTAMLLRPLLRRSQSVGEAVSEANLDVGEFLTERLRQLRLVRLAGTEAWEEECALRLLAQQRDGHVASETLAARLASTIEPIFIGFAFFCLWFGAAQLGLGLDMLGVFLVIVLRLVPIGKDLLGSRQIVLRTSSALELVDRTLARLKAAREVDQGSKKLGATAPCIRFDGVSFKYDSGMLALEGVDIVLPAGRITALVGPSGAGKSTLVDLLPRLRLPTAGRISFDDVDAQTIQLASLRAGIAYVPQQPQVFNGNVADHIRYGRPGATDREVEEALALAQCGFVNSLPGGLAAQLGENGNRLSGGQRQRLDIARALVRRAPVLILDEPTSALDAESERLFLEALLLIRSKLAPTILIVAHNLSLALHADQVVVLQAGSVTQRGTHDELVGGDGWYARSWSTLSKGAPSADHRSGNQALGR